MGTPEATPGAQLAGPAPDRRLPSRQTPIAASGFVDARASAHTMHAREIVHVRIHPQASATAGTKRPTHEATHGPRRPGPTLRIEIITYYRRKLLQNKGTQGSSPNSGPSGKDMRVPAPAHPTRTSPPHTVRKSPARHGESKPQDTARNSKAAAEIRKDLHVTDEVTHAPTVTYVTVTQHVDA